MLTMPVVTIGKTFTFDAAHQLPGHDGKCARPHGHTYRVDVEVTGELVWDGPKAGMVRDFADVKAAYREIHDIVDHQDLNVVLGDVIPHTTAEWIAVWILAQFQARVDGVTLVRVWETPTSFAEVRV